MLASKEHKIWYFFGHLFVMYADFKTLLATAELQNLKKSVFLGKF